MKQEILKDTTETLRFTPPWIDNRPMVADSATVVLKKPAGETLQASVAVTAINAVTGELTYTLTSTHTKFLDENYVAEWTYVLSSVNHFETTLFDVVLHRLSQLTTDEDLYALQGDIRLKNENVQGNPTSSTGSTLVDTGKLKNFPDNYFNNGTVEVSDPSTGIIQKRTVTDFVQSTGTLSISPDWATNPDTTYLYVAYKPYRVKLDFSWDSIMNDIRAKGFRPALIMQSSTLKQVHAYKTLELICMDFIRELDDVWDVLSARYLSKYNDAFGKLLFQYDVNEDGLIEGGEENKSPARLKMVR